MGTILEAVAISTEQKGVYYSHNVLNFSSPRVWIFDLSWCSLQLMPSILELEGNSPTGHGDIDILIPIGS
jgi:hypothetical protein